MVEPARGEARPPLRAQLAQALALGVAPDRLRPAMLAATAWGLTSASYVVGILRELHRQGAP